MQRRSNLIGNENRQPSDPGCSRASIVSCASIGLLQAQRALDRIGSCLLRPDERPLPQHGNVWFQSLLSPASADSKRSGRRVYPISQGVCLSAIGFSIAATSTQSACSSKTTRACRDSPSASAIPTLGNFRFKNLASSTRRIGWVEQSRPGMARLATRMNCFSLSLEISHETTSLPVPCACGVIGAPCGGGAGSAIP